MALGVLPPTREMECTEDTTMGVRIEEEMRVIRAMQIVTKLWVSVRKSDRDGCRVSLIFDP